MRTLAPVVILFGGLAVISGSAAADELLSLESLQDSSAMVVLGQAGDSESRWQDGAVVTDTEILVRNCLTGLCPESVTVTSTGGRIEDVSQPPRGAAALAPGAEVVVFLRPLAGRFVPVGMSQGVFEILRSDEPAVAVRRLGTEDVTAPDPGLTYRLDELVNSIRLGLPVSPLAQAD